MAQRTGRAFIYIDGTLQETMKGATLDAIIGLEREAVVGSQVYGYSEDAKAATLNCSFAHGPGISMEAIGAITDSAITFQTDSGVIFNLEGAFYASGKLDVDGHKVDCVFMAPICQEQLPS
jgi:hypothetical protein